MQLPHRVHENALVIVFVVEVIACSSQKKSARIGCVRARKCGAHVGLFAKQPQGVGQLVFK